MKTSAWEGTAWRDWISPLRITLLAVNAVCFGGCLVRLALGSTGGPLVLLAIATGISLTAGLAGAIIASRKQRAHWAEHSLGPADK